MDKFSNETHPYQVNANAGVGDMDGQLSAEEHNRSLTNERNPRSRTVEASMKRNKQVYNMPISRHIGKHVYGREQGSQLMVKRSLQGSEGPMKLEKINHEIRIR